MEVVRGRENHSEQRGMALSLTMGRTATAVVSLHSTLYVIDRPFHVPSDCVGNRQTPCCHGEGVLEQGVYSFLAAGQTDLLLRNWLSL